MAKMKKRRLHWKASPSPQVVGYKLYWSAEGGVDYDSACVRLGNVTEIMLPDDVEGLAGINGPIEFGIAAVDEVGNESDLITLKAPFQFRVPQSPSGLWLDTHQDSSAHPADTLARPVLSVPAAEHDPVRPVLIPSNERRFTIQNG